MDDVVQRLRAGLDAGAIDLADIMDAADEIERLRRGTAVSDNCVSGNQPEIPCHVTEPMPKEKRAEVSRAKPVAWGVKDGREFAELCADEEEARGAAKYYGGCTVVPLYRHPKPTLTDAEREALSWFTGGRGPVCPQHLATIRGLMARLS